MTWGARGENYEVECSSIALPCRGVGWSILSWVGWSILSWGEVRHKSENTQFFITFLNAHFQKQWASLGVKFWRKKGGHRKRKVAIRKGSWIWNWMAFVHCVDLAILTRPLLYSQDFNHKTVDLLIDLHRNLNCLQFTHKARALILLVIFVWLSSTVYC